MNLHTQSLPVGVSLETQADVPCVCPSCGAPNMVVFYRVESVPVHSCLLISDRNQAMTFPTGRLCLGLCEACGFICNLSFDPRAQHYSAQYEETQGFSPRFRASAPHKSRTMWPRKYWGAG